eukprot:3783046-Amphidinium_carterae.1
MHIICGTTLVLPVAGWIEHQIASRALPTSSKVSAVKPSPEAKTKNNGSQPMGAPPSSVARDWVSS